ncbi:hypothetical protein SLE2022_099180 [Rubroshorea leprosula]
MSLNSKSEVQCLCLFLLINSDNLSQLVQQSTFAGSFFAAGKMSFEQYGNMPVPVGVASWRSEDGSLVHSRSFMASGTDNVGYSVIQGRVGQDYDIFLAVKQKDTFGNPKPSLKDASGSPKLSLKDASGNPKPNRKDAYGNPKPSLIYRQHSSSSSDNSSDEETKEKVWKPKIDELPSKLEGSTSFDELPSKLEGITRLGSLGCTVAGTVRLGPWGGTGGNAFDDGTYTGIRQINLSRNVGIVWMKVCYDCDGQAVWGSKHGGTGGFKNDKIIFDYPSEILTHIWGTYGPLMYMGPNIIKSLTFYTNKGKHGPFGEEQGPSFTNQMNEGKIIGFHGREGLFLDAIGVHVIEGKVPPPKPPLSRAIIQNQRPLAEIEYSPWSNKLVLAKRETAEEVPVGVVKEPLPCGPGPWGGDGGKSWDDGVFSGIKQIFVTKAEAICSIQIEYDRNGQSLWSVKHGGHSGTTTHRVKLNYPHEVLTRISGYYGCIKEENITVVRSLTFYTSRGTYGPFGEEIGTYFTSALTDGKVVGLHGRSSMYLDAIGVHIQHWLGNHKTGKSSLFKIF